MSDVRGKRIIVTGGSGGIGAAAVRALAAAGARVACTYQSNEPDLPDGVVWAQCDIADQAQVTATFNTFARQLGGLDGLIHAAGVHGWSPADQITGAEWDRMFALNGRGTLFTNQAAFVHLRDRGGAIVNMGSVEGVRGMPGGALYAATRGAVMAWTRSVAREWGQFNIRVNAAAPVIETQLARRIRGALDDASQAAMAEMLRADIPIGGVMGDPDRDMAPVLVFLMSDASHFITGQTISVDGGYMMVGS
jgi:NAD(P)-dependent dehydrogenase (short-subunit alcohol dehydrogenase family)